MGDDEGEFDEKIRKVHKLPKIGKEKIQREKGFIYYIGKDGYVWAAPMKHNKTGKKKKIGTEKIAKEKGFLYYIGKDGFIEKTKTSGKRK